MINKLPKTFSLSDEDEIRAALDAYNLLSAAGKAEVTNYSKIKDAIKMENLQGSEFVRFILGSPKVVKATGEDEPRGNMVTVDVGLKQGYKISELEELNITILQGEEKISTITLKEDKISGLGNETTASFYTKVKATTSWTMDNYISGEVDEKIFDKMELRFVKDGTIYVVTSTVMK